MTTPTSIVCPDCGHPIVWNGQSWHDEGKSNNVGCTERGCKCRLSQQQALEKFVEQDRAETRRATIAELLTETTVQEFVHDVVALAETHPALLRAMLATENKLKAAQAQAQELTRATLLKAAKACCYNCRAGVFRLVYDDELYWHMSGGRRIAICEAHEIHKLMAADDKGSSNGQ